MQFRELLRECPGIPRVAPRMALFQKEKSALNLTGLAPRIFFIFPPFLREGGGGVRGEGEFLQNQRKKGGKRGGGRGGVDAGKGSGHFLGGGVLNIYFEG